MLTMVEKKDKTAALDLDSATFHVARSRERPGNARFVQFRVLERLGGVDCKKRWLFVAE